VRGLTAQPSAGLAGRTVILLEARRAREIAGLVRRYGGEPWSVPAMQELPPDDSSESVARLRELCEQGADVVVCLTGVGVRAMFELAAQLGLEARLRAVFAAAIIAIRGPKPAAVLRGLGLRIDREAAEPNTSREVLASLAGDTFATAAVQLYGAPDPELRAGLEARGARVLELPLYRWAMPADTGPLLDLIDNAGRAQALAVTSATQVRNLFALADREGKKAHLREVLAGLAVAAVGPVAAAALRDQAVHVDVVPDHPHMGAMIRDLARWFEPAR
jgi:uroporphyrinogen-III synthase